MPFALCMKTNAERMDGVDNLKFILYNKGNWNFFAVRCEIAERRERKEESE